MKLLIKSVEMHNFMSFADEKFIFNDFKGMTRIKGKNLDIPNQLNGSGKTNILNALVYGLFGDLPFNLKNENINNRYLNDKNTYVTVLFDVSNIHYKVVSGFRGKQSYCELYEMSKDGKEKDITKSTIAETRKYIKTDILHCDTNLFMRTVYLNSDSSYNFYNLKAAERKDFIDKLFDISIFGDIYATIHRDKLRMDKDIITIQNKLIILNRNTDEYKTKGDEFEKTRTDRMTDIVNNLTKTKKNLEEKRSKVIEKNTDMIDKCNSKIDKIETSVNNISEEIQSLNSRIMESEHRISRLNSSINDKKKIIDKHSELYGKLCDDCRPIFSKYHNLDTYRSEIESMTVEIGNETTKKNSLFDKMTEKNSKKKEYLENLEKLSTYLKNTISSYEKERDSIKTEEMNVNRLETQLELQKNQTNPYVELSINNEKTKEEENRKYTDLVEEYKYIEFSESIVSQENLKKFIIHDLIGLLNNKIKYYLHKLGSNYDIVFDDEMKCDFVTSVKSGVEYNNFSKGEQARISIATCFAFRDFLSTRSNISSNILILDEFFDSNVDPVAIENIMDILKSFVMDNKQKIFIVSHRSEIGDDSFDNIIQVEKKDNISSIRRLV